MDSAHAEVRAAAGAARGNAQALRLFSAAIRARARRGVEEARWRHTRVTSTVEALPKRGELRYRSAWSDLSWRAAEHDLDEVLVPHDGKK